MEILPRFGTLYIVQYHSPTNTNMIPREQKKQVNSIEYGYEKTKLVHKYFPQRLRAWEQHEWIKTMRRERRKMDRNKVGTIIFVPTA